MENKYADRIGNIMVSNGIARLDFLTLKELHKDTNKADFELAFRLNIPVDGIMQAIDVLEKMKNDLLAQQTQQTASSPSEPAAHTPTTAPVQPAPPESGKQPKKLTREAFDKLPPEQQEKIRERAKQREQEKIRQQLGNL